MIWNKLTKVTFVGSDVLQFGVYDGVAPFNIGSRAAAEIMEELGLEPGYFFQEGMRKADEGQRIAKADHTTKNEVKKRRKVLRGQKKKKEGKTKEKEGNTYEAGAF